MKVKDYVDMIVGAFKRRKSNKLRKIMNRISHDASLSSSKVLLELAVIAYTLSKILTKSYIYNRKNEKILKEIENAFYDLLRMKKVNLPSLNKVKNLIKSLEAKDKRYVISLLYKGRLKIASSLYAEGISLGTAASFCGVDKQELLDYVGKTMMYDRLKDEYPVKKRIKELLRIIEG